LRVLGCGALRRVAAEYRLPRYGPARNRWDRYDLDAWMQDPEVFRRRDVVSAALGGRRRRRPGEWTPV